MAQFNAPQGYWEQAVHTVAYLLNRTPTLKNGWKTPYEIVYGRIPDISHLVPFYSPGIYHKTPEERKSSLSYKDDHCRMIGYNPRGKNQYKILLKTGAIINRRDVIFDEVSKNEPEPETPKPVPEPTPEPEVPKEKEPVVDEYPYWKPEEEVNNTNAIQLPDAPKSFSDALNSPERELWIEAISKELKEFDDREIFEIAEQDGRAMKSKLILRVKYDEN